MIISEDLGESKYVGQQYNVSGHIFSIVNRVNIPGVPGSMPNRKEIDSFSPSSASRMRKYLREAIPEYKVFITLTYPLNLGLDGRESKEHLKRFIQELKRYAADNGCDIGRWAVFWFLEFQANGNIHYHLFSTDRYPKEWVAATWYRIVGSEDKRHLAAGTRIESFKRGKRGMCAYATKYAAKQVQKTVPEGFGWVGRFWGVSGDKGRVAAAIFVSVGDIKAKAVKRAVNRLENTLNDGVSRGTIKDISKDIEFGGARVYYMCNDKVKYNIEMNICMLQSAIALYSIEPCRYVERDMFDILTDIDDA